jgi:hypothetical protein
MVAKKARFVTPDFGRQIMWMTLPIRCQKGITTVLLHRVNCVAGQLYTATHRSRHRTWVGRKPNGEKQGSNVGRLQAFLLWESMIVITA